MERAAAILFQIARRRQEAGDADNAVAALRRALQAVPGHPESSELLERVYYDGRRYQELDRYYRERISAATSEPERIDFLYKRAQLAEGEMNDPAEAVRVYTEIANLEPPNGPAAARLVELFLASHDYAKLAELRERQLGAIEEPNERIRIMSELAALYRDRLGDRDQSAVYLHAILQLDPENLGALGAYADHFRDKGDWGALADLLEFSFERARVRGGAAEEQVRRLEEIAIVSEKNLGDAERALHAWRRVEELAPELCARARGAAAPAAQGQELGPHGGAARARGQPAGRSRAEGRDPAPRGADSPREARRRQQGGRDLQAASCAPSRTTRWRCARWSRSSSARATSPAWPRSCASRSSSTP